MAKIVVKVGQESGEFEAQDANAVPVLLLAGRRLGIDPGLPVAEQLRLLAQKMAEWVVDLAQVEQAQADAREAEARARATIRL